LDIHHPAAASRSTFSDRTHFAKSRFEGDTARADNVTRFQSHPMRRLTTLAVCLRLRYQFAMRFIGSIIEKLQRHPKRIVFPEGMEPRVLQAARQFHCLRLGAPILLGDRTQIKEAAAALDLSLEGVRIIDPATSEDLDTFVRRFEMLRRLKGIKEKEARAAMLNPNYYGAMMVAMHQVDGIVSGTSEATGSVLRPFFQIIKVAPQAATASSCMIMEVEDTRFGENGVLFMADCGVIPDPTVDQLADIAVSTAQLARQLLGTRPRAALLSYATKGSATHRSIGKVQAATALAQQKAKEKNIEAEFDGELQVDAAIVPTIAERKFPESKVAGRANVLIFPDLNSGNIASKLVQHVARANAYGQILLGMDRPAADMSRGANAHDVLGVAAIIGVQSIAYNELYPDGELPGEG
jgi:phosphate acetyltransferase